MSNESQIVSAVLKAAEAAKYIGVSVTTLREYANRGLVDVVRLPKRLEDQASGGIQPRRKMQFRRQDLDAFLERQVEAQKTPTKTPTSNVHLSRKNVIQRGWWKSASR